MMTGAKTAITSHGRLLPVSFSAAVRRLATARRPQVKVLPPGGVVQYYFRGRSHVETNRAEQPPGQLLKSYTLYALRGIRVGLLAFVVLAGEALTFDVKILAVE